MLKGSCLCGAVTFAVNALAGPFELCHCHRCRKASGSVGLPMVSVRECDYQLLTGAAFINSYSAPQIHSPPSYRHHFCRQCGGPAPDPAPIDAVFEIPAGLFDDPLDLSLDKHIYVEYQAQWHALQDSLPRYDRRSLYALRTGGKSLPESALGRDHYTAADNADE